MDTGFRFEADMTPHVEEVVHILMPRRTPPQFVAREVPGPVGIIDLVAADFATDALQRRVDLDVAPVLSSLQVRALCAMPRNTPVRLEVLAARLDTSTKGILRSTLTPLARCGLIDIRGERVARTGLWEPLAQSLVAIELKLSKWRRAARQADNARLGTDRAWVVLDACCRRSALNAVPHFSAFGLGLALLHQGGTIEVLTRPRLTERPSWYRAWMAETVFSQWLLAQSDSIQVSRNPASERSRSTRGSESRNAIASATAV